MHKITITPDAVRLFAHTLHFFITHEDKWYAGLDDLWSDIFRMKNQMTRSSFESGDISEKEQDREYSETDSDINAWDNRFTDWRYKRYYLQRYLNHLRKQLREVCHALAS